MYHYNNKINSEKEIKVSKEEINVFFSNKPIELPKPKLERQVAFNIKESLPASKLWSNVDCNSKLWNDIVFNKMLDEFTEQEIQNKIKLYKEYIKDIENDNA